MVQIKEFNDKVGYDPIEKANEFLAGLKVKDVVGVNVVYSNLYGTVVYVTYNSEEEVDG